MSISVRARLLSLYRSNYEVEVYFGLSINYNKPTVGQYRRRYLYVRITLCYAPTEDRILSKPVAQNLDQSVAFINPNTMRLI